MGIIGVSEVASRSFTYVNQPLRKSGTLTRHAGSLIGQSGILIGHEVKKRCPACKLSLDKRISCHLNTYKPGSVITASMLLCDSPIVIQCICLANMFTAPL